MAPFITASASRRRRVGRPEDQASISPTSATGIIRVGECASDAWYADKPQREAHENRSGAPGSDCVAWRRGMRRLAFDAHGRAATGSAAGPVQHDAARRDCVRQRGTAAQRRAGGGPRRSAGGANSRCPRPIARRRSRSSFIAGHTMPFAGPRVKRPPASMTGGHDAF